MNIIKNVKYINKLKKETNDVEFINKINNIKQKIKKYNYTDKELEEKINKHN